MKYLNLGCGNRYHKSWTNVDFVGKGDLIMSHNLLHGIPFEKETFDVTYHSHVLEHFSKEDGETFIRECYRVLKPGGILRVAVPDLERIAKEYLRNLDLALKGDGYASNNYDWITLEMYDQTTRNESGGNMAKYLFQEEIPNESYVFERIGEEGKILRQRYLDTIKKTKPALIVSQKETGISILNLNSVWGSIKGKIKSILFKNEIGNLEIRKREADIGRFRLSGEIHQTMYDRYSLAKLLKEIGYINVEVKDTFTSQIPDWNKFELESKNGTVFKPDSLFMEAIKC